LQSNSVNDVCKLFQLLGDFAPESQWGVSFPDSLDYSSTPNKQNIVAAAVYFKRVSAF